MKEAGARGKSDTGKLVTTDKEAENMWMQVYTCMNGKWRKLRKGEKAGNNHIRRKPVMLRRKTSTRKEDSNRWYVVYYMGMWEAVN